MTVQNRRSRTAQRDAPPTDPSPPRGLDGLAQLRRLFEGEAPMPSMAATIGFAPLSLEPGRVAFAAEPGDHLLNPLGSVHGGFAATLLDSAMGCAVHSMLPPGATYGTIELKVNYVRAILPDTGRLRAEGTVIHMGRSIATADGRLVGMEDGKLYAHGSTTCAIRLPKGAAP